LFVPGTGEHPANFSGATDLLMEENGNGRKEHSSKVNQGDDSCQTSSTKVYKGKDGCRQVNHGDQINQGKDWRSKGNQSPSRKEANCQGEVI
jgi:hypothetical protein